MQCIITSVLLLTYPLRISNVDPYSFSKFMVFLYLNLRPRSGNKNDKYLVAILSTTLRFILRAYQFDPTSPIWYNLYFSFSYSLKTFSCFPTNPSHHLSVFFSCHWRPNKSSYQWEPLNLYHGSKHLKNTYMQYLNFVWLFQ